MVSNTGRIYSKSSKLVKKTSFLKDGHEVIMLSKNGRKYGTFVHRLVAKAFIPNPDNLPIINHKDENPRNNDVSNLEWCTYSYNNTYNATHLKRAEKKSKKVYKYDSSGKIVEIYDSAGKAAESVGASKSNICYCCLGKVKVTHGYVFSYEPISEEEIVSRFKNSAFFQNRKGQRKPKKVAQYDLNMNYLSMFESTNDAGRSLRINPSLIGGVCRGEHKTTHGYIFKYV